MRISVSDYLLTFQLFSLLNWLCVLAITSDDLYTEDINIGSLPSGDDLNSPVIVLTPAFHFFGASYSDIYISTNGLISIDVLETNYVPRPFPISNNLIAVFWGDADTSTSGTITYGRNTNNATLEAVGLQVRTVFPIHNTFTPSYVFVVTWRDVGYFGQESDALRNTFQCVLAADSERSFIIFQYPENGIQWTAGNSHGNNGQANPLDSSSIAAIAGFNFNDGVRVLSQTLPNSGTNAIAGLSSTSNVGNPGVWMFEVDGDEIGTPDDPCNANPCPTNTVCERIQLTTDYVCSFPDRDPCLPHPCDTNADCTRGGTFTPSSGLYFMLRSIPYLPGDTIPLGEMGEFDLDSVSDARSSLVCVTTNVNTACCRSSDGGNVGEWYFPDGTLVIRHIVVNTVGGDFSRSGFTEQVRLNRQHEDAFSPTGRYECRVPDSNGVLQVAAIILTNTTEHVTSARESFTCACREPFTEGDGFNCSVPDPCLSGPCDVNADCTREGLLTANFTCTCREPFTVGDGFSCSVPDPCLSDPCDVNADCTREGLLTANFTCTCREPFTVGDGFSCSIPDPCLDSPCDVNAQCEREGLLSPNFTCACREPFTVGDGFSCSIPDPCLSGPCDVNADCTREGLLSPNFTCECREPFTVGDGFSCSVPDPCLSGPCDVNADCTREGLLTANFMCMCREPFTEGDGFSCSVPDPCVSDPCDINADCTREGLQTVNFMCMCREPFTVGDGFSCSVPDPCLSDSCDINADCTRTGSLIPSTGLYFMLRGTPYLPGDTVPLGDIGSFDAQMPSDSRSSLVCVTTNVNTVCCRNSDGGNVGEWYFPDGTLVIRHSAVNTVGGDFSRSGFTEQVRLNRLHEDAFSPTGRYECRVPDSNGVLQVAAITLTDTFERVNTVSEGFTCMCREPFTDGDGLNCSVPDPCLSDPCDVNADCTREGLLTANFTCECREPFTVGDGFSCSIPDPCQSDPCDVNADCTREGLLSPNFTCACREPFTVGDGFSCSVPDPCLSGPCDINADCIREGLLTANFSCTCREPFTVGDGFSCSIPDPCLDSPCDVNAQCEREGLLSPNFTCTCVGPYTVGDGFNCSMPDPCLSNPCDVNANCTREGLLSPNFTCTCREPFVDGDGFSCSVPDPCLSDPCGINAECTREGLLSSNFTCECQPPFLDDLEDGFNCTDSATPSPLTLPQIVGVGITVAIVTISLLLTLGAIAGYIRVCDMIKQDLIKSA